jgi:putative ABC transport system permease protein
MFEAFRQSIENLRANKLRSLLTMFGILWGIVSIVLLSAAGEGFRRGNDAVLREFGKNIVIIRRGRTSMQAGGERAGRLVTLTLDDARALAAQSRLLKVVSPEIMRYGIRVKSRYNAASIDVHGVEPQYQLIRTIDLDYGRRFNWQDERQRHKVAIAGADVAEQLFGDRNALGEWITIGGVPFEVIGKMRKKKQDSDYSGPDDTKIFVPFASMQQDLPAVGLGYQPDSVSAIIVTPKDDVVAEVIRNLPVGTEPMFARDGIIELEIRGILGRRHGFDPQDKDAVNIWNTTLQTAMFDRIIVGMKDFFSAVGFITLALGGLGVMNIMLIAVKDRTVEIGVRKALGARVRDIQRQFFLEGFFLTSVSGGLGMALALTLCWLVNRLPLPDRFSGMIVTWETGLVAVATLVLVGVATSTYPARRAAALQPVEALRYER